MSAAVSGYTADPRIRWTEWLPWVAALACFFLLPEYLSLGARILIFILFALSLDLILGYAGIVTLGHSAFFGLGAYTAGILGAQAGVTDRFAQLAAAAAPPALLGLATGAVILRTRALTLLMLTLAITAILLEIANKGPASPAAPTGWPGVKVGADPRPVPLRPLRQDRLPLLPGDAVRRLVGGAPAHLLAVRRDAHRHPREHHAHARHRRAGVLAPGAGLHHLGDAWPASPARCSPRSTSSSA